MDASSKYLYEKLYDKEIIHDLRVVWEDSREFIFSVPKSRYKIRIPKTCNSEIAYLAGVIAGDGCFNYSKRENLSFPYVRISISSGDQAHLKEINKLFIDVFGVKGVSRKDKRKRNCHYLFVNHRLLFTYFRNYLGLDKRSLKVPELLKNKDLFKYFLAGFFDTDGYCSKRRFGLMLAGKQLDFLKELKTYAELFYSIYFSTPKLNDLQRQGKIFKRAYMTLPTEYFDVFRGSIPLLHSKYEWAREESNLGSLVSSRNTPKDEFP